MTLRMFFSPHKAGQIHQVQSLLFQICGEILHLKRTPVKRNWIFLRALIFTTCILSFLLSATIMLPSSSTVTPFGLVNSPSLVPSEPRNWRGKKIKLQTVLKQDYPILGKANFLTWAPWKSALMTSSRWLLKSVTTAWEKRRRCDWSFITRYQGHLIVRSEWNATGAVEVLPKLAVKAVLSQKVPERRKQLKEYWIKN